MDVYTMLRLYHRMLRQCWKDNSIKININEFVLDDLFMVLFKSVPVHHVILLSLDGKTTHVPTMNDPTPDSFKTRRFMKIDNRSSMSSIKNVIRVLFQLLSIDTDDTHILDLIGLVQFLMSFVSENSHLSIEGCLIFSYIKKSLFNGPSFYPDTWKKEIRDPVLSDYYDSIDHIDHIHESMLQRLEACHRLIKTLCDTLTLHDERMDGIESLLHQRM